MMRTRNIPVAAVPAGATAKSDRWKLPARRRSGSLRPHSSCFASVNPGSQGTPGGVNRVCATLDSPVLPSSKLPVTYRYFCTAAALDRVLPFVNMSAIRSRTNFSDGLSEELLNSLVAYPDAAGGRAHVVVHLQGKMRTRGHCPKLTSAQCSRSVRKDGNGSG